MITQKRLKELFHYDPETGVFTRLVRTSSQGNLGVVKNKPNDGYIAIKVDKKEYKAHRLAWLYVHGRFPSEQIDHINHDRADNRFINLREATNQENQMNRSKCSRNTSGFLGVSWYKTTGRWTSQIQVNNKKIRLGYFKNKEDAIAAREAANIKYGFHDNHGKELFDSGEQLVYKQRCHNGKTQQHEKENNMSFDFDEGDTGGASGPFLNWHAREKLDGSMPSRSFSIRTDDGLKDVTKAMEKGVALDLNTLRTGWCFSNGTPGVAPEWLYNTTPARFDQPQPADRGEDRWKKGFTIRIAIGKDQACSWSQAGAGAWAGLVSLMKAVKADGGEGECVIAAMSGVEEIKFAKGGTSAPEFTIKKWSKRPECLTEQAVVEAAVEEDDSDDEF